MREMTTELFAQWVLEQDLCDGNWSREWGATIRELSYDNAKMYIEEAEEYIMHVESADKYMDGPMIPIFGAPEFIVKRAQQEGVRLPEGWEANNGA